MRLSCRVLTPETCVPMAPSPGRAQTQASRSQREAVDVTAIPVLDGGPVPREAAVRAVAWYGNVRAKHPDALVIVNCLMGASRSATIAYAILRRCHGLAHAEAFRRVATRAHKATDTRFWPSEETLSDVRAWCDASEAT